MKKSVTVGVFTYQRPLYLERQLGFFKDLNFDSRLIILDGSETQLFRDQNKMLAAKYNAEYVNEVGIMNRHALYFEKLDTEFSSWAADDDLIVPSFFTNGATFLRDHKDYSAIAGKTYTLNYLRKQPEKGYFLGNDLENNYDILYGDLVEKIVRRDQSYQLGTSPTFYGVKRYEVVKKFAEYAPRITYTSSMERLDMVCSLLMGGIKVIDTLMGFRDYASETSRFETREDPKTYISKKDSDVIEELIKNELKDHIKSQELLDYIAGYVWKLPIRPPQGSYRGLTGSWQEKAQSRANLYFAHRWHTFDNSVTKAMRKSMMIDALPAGQDYSETKTFIYLLFNAVKDLIQQLAMTLIKVIKSIIKAFIPKNILHQIRKARMNSKM